MVGIFILFIFTHVHNGRVLTTQEFYSMEQCKYAASLAFKQRDVYQTYCIKK